jgi:hypothetical protein
MRIHLPAVSIPTSATLLAVLALAACGRTGLDEPVSVGGGGGGAGGGTSGSGGHAGASPDAAAAGTGAQPAACGVGTAECVNASQVRICSDGAWGTPFTCPQGCIKGVCAECAPGTASCVSSTALQVCNGSGILLDAVPCPGMCAGDACVGCSEGSTRCASHEAQQTCKGGNWTVATDCPFVCVGTACGQNPRTVFVTSDTFVGGSLGGLAGADARCTKWAAGVNLPPGPYLAWLSDATGSPVSRFPEDVGPYVLTDGTVVANNWSDLTSGKLRHVIDRTQMGNSPPPSTGGCAGQTVWSNTSLNGTIKNPAFSCGDWSDPMARNAAWGNATSLTAWTDSCTVSGADPALACLSSASLYCFQQ